MRHNNDHELIMDSRVLGEKFVLNVLLTTSSLATGQSVCGDRIAGVYY